MFIEPLRFLEQRVGAGIYMLDISTNKMIWSDGVYRILNLTRGAVTPSRSLIRDFIHPEDRQPTNEMDALFSSGVPFKIKRRIILRDRRVRWISNEGDFLMDTLGKPETVIGVIRDITVSHHTTELKSTYAEQLSAVLNTIKGVVWTATPSGELTSVPNWKQSLAAEEEPLGRALIDLIHPDERAAGAKAWAAAIAGGIPYIQEHRMLHSDGTYHWQRCTAGPVKSSDGTIRKWIGVTQDIEKEKRGISIRKPDAAATGAQIRAARGILRLSVRDLSDTTSVPIGVIRRLEEVDGILNDDRVTSILIRTELERQGVVFIFPEGHKPAVCPA